MYIGTEHAPVAEDRELGSKKSKKMLTARHTKVSSNELFFKPNFFIWQELPVGSLVQAARGGVPQGSVLSHLRAREPGEDSARRGDVICLVIISPIKNYFQVL